MHHTVSLFQRYCIYVVNCFLSIVYTLKLCKPSSSLCIMHIQHIWIPINYVIIRKDTSIEAPFDNMTNLFSALA